MRLTPPTKLTELARDLGIGEKHLTSLKVKFKTEATLIANLQKWWLDSRDQPRLLARRSVQGYTHESFAAMAGHRHEDGYEDEPEAVDPAKIETYRASRDAKLRFEKDQIQDAADVVAAMHNLRDAIDGLPSDQKRRMSKTMWTLRSRLDSAERELRRRAAA